MSDDSTISDVKCDHLVMVVSGKFFFLKIPLFSPLQLVINQWGAILAFTNNLPPNFIGIHY